MYFLILHHFSKIFHQPVALLTNQLVKQNVTRFLFPSGEGAAACFLQTHPSRGMMGGWKDEGATFHC